jgi:hypothetical protein
MLRVATWALALVGAMAACKAVELGSSSCVVSDISIDPGTATVPVGGTLPLHATLSQEGCVDPKIFWSSDRTNLATVGQNGVVTGVAAGGPVQIAASAMGKSGTAMITVQATPVASVAVVAPAPSVLAGRTLQLTATLRDAQGNPLTGRVVTWSTSTASVATVSNAGLVTGVAAGGPVTITATSQGKSGSVSLVVLGRFGYAVVTDPAGSSTLSAPTSFNSSGLSIDAVHLGTGTHSVTFQGLAKPSGSETVMANALGSNGSSCAVTSWGSSGSALTVNTQCVNASGRRENTPFEVFLLGDDGLTGRTAFARATNATATSAYTPPAGVWHNPSGKGITITRSGTGRYEVTFTGNGRVSGSAAETVLVSAFGADVYCQVIQWNATTATVSVGCTDALGVPRNSQFTIAMIERGRIGQRVAYTLADCSSGSCAASSPLTFTTGGGVSIARTSAGVYRVTLSGLARGAGATDAVFVSAVSNLGGTCKPVTWADALNGRDMEVTVQCYGLGIVPADLDFDLLFIQ